MAREWKMLQFATAVLLGAVAAAAYGQGNFEPVYSDSSGTAMVDFTTITKIPMPAGSAGTPPQGASGITFRYAKFNPPSQHRSQSVLVTDRLVFGVCGDGTDHLMALDEKLSIIEATGLRRLGSKVFERNNWSIVERDAYSLRALQAACSEAAAR